MNSFEILKISPDASREEIHHAYRTLARRWHPDRFTRGPERDWASEKMAQINAAYKACMKLCTHRGEVSAKTESRALESVEQLMQRGEYVQARQTLTALSMRTAQWNYLFGATLLKLGEVQKALTYLEIAARQQPEEERYLQALRSASKLQRKTLILKKLFKRIAPVQ